jgi:CRISPR-associated protein Csx10
MITGMLQIEMLSDWHIGSGTGRPGSIDRLVQRDSHNLPYIPAKSLTGIWRDGCELVAQGLDAGQSEKPWQQWVNWLFGEQQPGESENRAITTAPLTAKLSVRSAHFPRALQEAFRGNVMLQSMTTFVKPGVKIDPLTGSALAEHLRFEEMTRSGAVLEAEYRLQIDLLTTDQQPIAKAILVAGALMVERLGAKRRRGAGRCKISVNGLLKENQAIAAIEKTQGQPPAPPPLSESDPVGTLALGDRSDSGWWRVVLEITTQSPVIIHKRTVGNHQETQDCIPGTYLVPIIRKHLDEQLNTSLGNALMHGDVVITNANPVVKGVRGEAVPFALFTPKAKTEVATIHQRLGKAIETNEAIETNSADGQQLKGIRSGYVCLQEKTLYRVTVNPEIAAHNTIVDAKQRPDSEVGGIYTYAAIPTGETFQLEIRIRDYLVPQNAVNPLAKFLATETSVQIGRTKKDDYGKVTLKQIKSGKIADGAQNQAGSLTVWLLSDLLLRDQRLRPTVDPQVLGKRLAEELGVTLTLLEEPQEGLPQINTMVAFARSSRTESWQTKWGLPRPSLIGLSAGTVLQFKVAGHIAPQSLQALEISGFGERTAEGYGQLRFNPALLTQPGMEMAQANEHGKDTVPEKRTLIAKNTPTYEYAKLVETETWREMIRRAAGAIAADPGKVPFSLSSSKLTRSKLGTLRTLVDSLSSANDATRILAVITRMETKETWKGSTLAEVKQLLADSTKVWEYYQAIGCNLSQAQYRLTSVDEQTLKQELWVEAVRILVDACVRAHKRASEQPKSQEQANGETN